MLEDAQKKVGRSGRTIANKMLLLFARKAMVTTERYLRTNGDWEDRAEDQKHGPTGKPPTRGLTQKRA